jgi:hypothetical protein
MASLLAGERNARWRINGKIELARRQIVAPDRGEMQFPVIRKEEVQ